MFKHSFFPRKVITVSRILLGLMFFVFGLNGFLQFMPQLAMPKAAVQFMGALVQSGYMMPIVFSVQLFAGIALLANRFVPLALILLVPVIVNTIGFHLSLAPARIMPGIIAAVLNLYLLVAYLPTYKPVLSYKKTYRSSH